MKRRSRVTLFLLTIAILLTEVGRGGFCDGFDSLVDATIRTSCLQMTVASNSEIGVGPAGSQFSYFADGSSVPGYLHDGYLILGNSAENLSYSTAESPSVGVPSSSNPFGYLLRATPSMSADSTSYSNQRVALGSGYNRDSTLQFDIAWYASKIPDSCDFLVEHFRLYKGPNGGTVTNLFVAYFADWDIPSDSAAQNYSGADPARYMMYQRGAFRGGNNTTRFGAIGAAVEGGKAVGGFSVPNDVYLDPEGTWENDSIWNRLNMLAQDQYLPGPYTYPSSGTGITANLSSIVLIKRGVTIAASDTLDFIVCLAGQPQSSGSPSGVSTMMTRAYWFACDRNLVPGARVCSRCKCGDCDNNGIWTISDAVCLLWYLFWGGPYPGMTCLGDADGNKIITISDAVYIITHVFGGGPAPAGC